MMQRWSNGALFGFAMGVLLCGAFWAAQPAQGENVKDARVYELRTYIAQPGKLEELHARFRNHTVKLFEKHGMKNIVYLNPSDEKKAADTLVYLLSHDSKEAADASWKGFRADPDWIAARTKSEENGPLVKTVISEFFTPTDYSPMK